MAHTITTSDGRVIKKPTERALLAWWQERRSGTYTCVDCGRTDSYAYVQPQHPYYADGREDVARCGECVNDLNRKHREARKAQLDAMTRCIACSRRSTSTVSGVDLCGHHLNLARRRFYGGMGAMGGLALFLPAEQPSADLVRSWVLGRQ